MSFYLVKENVGNVFLKEAGKIVRILPISSAY